MIWVAALDPASLALWYNPQMIVRGESGDKIALATHSAIFGDVAEAINVLTTTNNSVYTRAVYITSTVWHEHRHFLDLVLTNYGASRFRDFLSLYINSIAIFKTLLDEGERIVLPLEIYCDPVRSRINNIKVRPDIVQEVGKNIKARDFVRALDKSRIPTSIGSIEVGGQAQLEALAYICQLGAVETFFGSETVLNIQQSDFFDKELARSKYSWAVAAFGQEIGITPFKHKDMVVADPATMMPVLFASLMIRSWGQASEDDAKQPQMPSVRFKLLIDEMELNLQKTTDRDILSIWEEVNEVSKRLWGKTINEELKDDFDQEAKFLDQVLQHDFTPDSVKKVFNDFHSLREAAIELLEASPLMFLDPEEYSRILLHEICPIPIIAYDSGSNGTPPQGWDRLLGYKHEQNEFWWAAVPSDFPTDTTGVIAFNESHAWYDVFSQYAPLVKLMMKGRKSPIMLGPEVVVIENMLKTRGIDIHFEKMFALTSNIVSPLLPVYNIAGVTEFKCDWCSDSVKYPNGYLISSWYFRNNQTALNLMVERIGYDAAIKDWSPWAVCNSCKDTLLSSNN